LDHDCESLRVSSTSSKDLNNDSEFEPNSKTETDSEQQVSEDGNVDDIDNDSILSSIQKRGDGSSSNQSIEADSTSVRSSRPSSPGNHSKSDDSVQKSPEGPDMNPDIHESDLEGNDIHSLDLDITSGTYWDIYESCETREYLSMDISSIPTCVSSGRNRAGEYLSAPFVKKCFSNRLLF
jgi:hypothetical protein